MLLEIDQEQQQQNLILLGEAGDDQLINFQKYIDQIMH